MSPIPSNGLLNAATADGVLVSKPEDLALGNLQKYIFLARNKLTTIPVLVESTVDKIKAPVGRVARCSICNHTRPIALFSANKICGFCQNKNIHSGAEEWPGLGPNPENPLSVKESDEITWVACSVKHCGALYPIFNVERLRGKPKCYFCRKQQPCPIRECKDCGCKVVTRVGEVEERRPWWVKGKKWKGFTCPLCVAGYPKVENKVVTVECLLADNGYEWIGIHQRMAFSTPQLTARQIMEKFGWEAFCPENGLFNLPPRLAPLKTDGRRIHTPTEDIVKAIMCWVKDCKVQKATCTICFEKMNKEKMVPACGRRGCSMKADELCLERHYSTNKPGEIINFGALTCPFCRRYPIPKILHRYGLDLIRDRARSEAENSQWWSAWCSECFLAARVLEKVCSVEPPVLDGFKCALCRPPPEEEQRMGDERDDTRRKIRPCPRCHTMTQKTEGCNHITCSVCRAHWCWKCQFLGVERESDEDSAKREVYAHLYTKHGGYYDWDVFLHDPDDGEQEQQRRELRQYYRGGDAAFQAHMQAYAIRMREIHDRGQVRLPVVRDRAPVAPGNG
ncbi:hypothetical protein EV426DRAFT_331428 [Tirmania nivea]|nr:hypothetical protein EV426DRAFT_331428 [Tirmania nivea]